MEKRYVIKQSTWGMNFYLKSTNNKRMLYTNQKSKAKTFTLEEAKKCPKYQEGNNTLIEA